MQKLEQGRRKMTLSASQTTLRLDILREAIDQYKAINKANQVNSLESTLAVLKIMECELMIRELMKEEEK
jgi:hypothetical protein